MNVKYLLNVNIYVFDVFFAQENISQAWFFL